MHIYMCVCVCVYVCIYILYMRTLSMILRTSANNPAARIWPCSSPSSLNTFTPASNAWMDAACMRVYMISVYIRAQMHAHT